MTTKIIKDMTGEDRQLVAKALCGYLPYGLKFRQTDESTITLKGLCIDGNIITVNPKMQYGFNLVNEYGDLEYKPYLRSLSSMTKQDVIELAELCGFKNILSVKVNQYHIIVEVDDGVCSSERHIIWFNEIVSSIGILDWLLKNHFDFRGLIEHGLALPAPEGMYDN